MHCPRWLPHLVVLLILALALAPLGAGCSPQAEEQEPEGPTEAIGLEDQAATEEVDEEDNGDEEPEATMTLELAFVHETREHWVEREVPETERVAFASLEAMREGFVYGGDTVYPLPQGTQVLGVDIWDGIAYADFSRELVDNHWGGVEAELDTIYSVVHTLTQYPTVDRVQFLVDGSQVDTIATGALDLTEPVAPAEDLSPEACRQLEEQARGWQEPEPEAILGWSRLVVEQGQRSLGPQEVRDAQWADLEGDEQPEIIYGLPGGLVVLEAAGNGFEHAWEYWISDMVSVEAADTTGDGRQELFAVTEDEIALYEEKNGDLQHQGWQSLPQGLRQAVVADTTGNQRSEVVLLSRDGNSEAEDYQATIEIWRYENENYVQAFQAEEMPYRHLVPGDIDGQRGEELLAFGQDSTAVFAWNGQAYVELHRNPGAGGYHARAAVGDVTGDGRREVAIVDGLQGGVYLYTWKDDVLQKIWQGEGPTGDIGENPPVALDLSGDGSQELVVPANGGGFLVLGFDGDEVLAAQVEAPGQEARIHGLTEHDGEQVLLYSYRRGDGSWRLAWGPVLQENLEALWEELQE